MPPGPRIPRRFDQALARRGGSVECLRLPAGLFAAAASLRGRLYDRGLLPSLRLDTPVISVGNLAAGGTGKTPMTIWLARQALQRGLRPGILSRGYHGDAEGINDEGRLLQRVLPEVPHVQNRNRVAGGQALERLGVDWILLDDGFQHRRLARDLDLVLIDATRPWGLPAPPDGGEPVCATLPRGLLRERPSALQRAHLLVITRADGVDPEPLARLRGELADLAPGVGQVLASHRPVGLKALVNGHLEERDLASLSGMEVDLVCAIGNPEAFERTARAVGACPLRRMAFPDHHAYEPADLASLGGRPVLTTAKDAVKLMDTDLDVLVLEVAFEILAGNSLLEALLDSLPTSSNRLERDASHAGLHG